MEVNLGEQREENREQRTENREQREENREKRTERREKREEIQIVIWREMENLKLKGRHSPLQGGD
ncbi:hypothetical protein FJ651_06590 [Paucihalobacter ruber]|uniref:Uncharacterized protein n=1 Tax=Paucihalobacter ruber TaxID=2567861 RepID=A0A506PNT0_9FLAO|nr:hypothetical protein [Paucihalobacter ruber]TPV33820.1 hypothetical protein FJ651_06590 [Paucihalobacter ruber]